MHGERAASKSNKHQRLGPCGCDYCILRGGSRRTNRAGTSNKRITHRFERARAKVETRKEPTRE